MKELNEWLIWIWFRSSILNPNWAYLKLVSAIFIKFLFFHQMIALQKLWKMLFISSKMLFSFSRYSIFCIFVLPYFSTCRCFREWSKINLEIHDVINSLKKSSITNFIWYLEKEKRYDHEILSINGVSDKERSYRKIMQKMYSKS